LEALLGLAAEGSGPQVALADAGSARRGEEETVEGLIWVDVGQLESNPYQPRQDFDAETLSTLTQSIEEHGMLQPIVVRRVGDRFQVVAGERRLRAAVAAGWNRVPAQLHDCDDRQLAELAIVENIQRKDLNPLEKAACFRQYLQQYQCTQDDLARRIKIDRSTIANLIRLLELPEAVQQALRAGLITMGHARALLPLGDEREQIAFCERIQRESLSVRITEETVQAMIRAADVEPLSVVGGNVGPANPRRTRSEHLAILEQQLRSALGTKVDIRQTGRGSGRIVIHFRNHQEFDRIRGHLDVSTTSLRSAQIG
jgi:ParB family chromosome partitioning protein